MSNKAMTKSAEPATNLTTPLRIRAVDLTTRPGTRHLWRPSAAPPGGPAAVPVGPGRPSPMAFWLTEGEGPGPAEGAAFEVLVYAPGDAPTGGADLPGPRPAAGFGRPARTVRIKGPGPNDGELLLTLTATAARVVARPAAWSALSEPVLLAVCQSWRFAALDAALERLTDRSGGDLGHASMAGLATLRQGKRIVTTAVEVRALLLDLAHFAGPLTDPYPFLSSERAVQAYQDLAEKLHLEEWSEAIDERVEMVEDTYACATEKLFELKNFAWEAALEVLIILLLGTEVVLQFVNHFTE